MEFIKHIQNGRKYHIKLPNSHTSTIQYIKDGWVKVISPRKIITIVNVNLISFVERNTVGTYSANIAAPQSVLHWLWLNLQIDEFDE